MEFTGNHWVESLGGRCTTVTLRWRHNGHDSVSNHQPRHCLLNRLFGCRSKKTSKLRVTGLCARNSPGTGEFPAQMASNAENVAIWWRYHVRDNVSMSWSIHGKITFSQFLLQTRRFYELELDRSGPIHCGNSGMSVWVGIWQIRVHLYSHIWGTYRVLNVGEA